MTRYCLALDLKEDPTLIAAYEDYHASVWPEIIASIKEAGIKALEIYRVANRLFMIIEAGDDFSFEKKAALDMANPKVQEWEAFLGQYQTNLPGTPPNWRWALTEKIFSFTS